MIRHTLDCAKDPRGQDVLQCLESAVLGGSVAFRIVNSLHEKGLPLRNTISPGGRHLSGSATCSCHRFGPDRATQAAPDRATRTIRQPAGPFSVPRRSISVYPYRNTNVTVAYANTYSDSNPRRNTYTYWDSNAHLLHVERDGRDYLPVSRRQQPFRHQHQRLDKQFLWPPARRAGELLPGRLDQRQHLRVHRPHIDPELHLSTWPNSINESFLNQSIPEQYQYYRVRMQFYNCGIYFIYSPAASVCRPGSTPTPTGTPTGTPTPSPTATATPIPSPTPTAPPLVSISGTLLYCSNPSPGPVPNVTLTLTGTMSGSTLSDGFGNYTFSSLPSGGNYTVTPSKAALAPGSVDINTVDVIAIQRHFLVLGTPSRDAG